MLTEEDTFNALRRVPFRVLFVSILDPVSLGKSIVPEDRTSSIIQAGWTREEFDEIVSEEMSKGNITGDISQLRSKSWRQELLGKEPIY
jgi:hypothetical protein